jgi:hypothetical protein
VPHSLNGLAVEAGNFVVVPHRLELRTEPPELIDKRLHLSCSAGSCCVYPERTECETSHLLPVILSSADAWYEKEVPQGIALPRWQESIAVCHRRGAARCEVLLPLALEGIDDEIDKSTCLGRNERP